MKILRIFLAIIALSVGIFPATLAQDPQQSSNFVVIGAFSKLDNAVQFTDAANQDNFQAQYAINTQRKLYYVYILNAFDSKKASSFLFKIRGETKYKEAWIYTGKLGEETEPTLIEHKPTTLADEKPVEPVVMAPVVEELTKKDSIPTQLSVADSSTLIIPVQDVVEKPAGKPFYFKLVNSDSKKEVMGEVQLVESKSVQYQGFKGNELVYLRPPNNSTGVYQIIIQSPGYKPAKMSFNYADPSAVSAGLGDKQETILAFELVGAKKRDYIDFNNVRFFSNASVLEPSSQNELDGLLALMKENTNYKIKIHGHCNGDDSREIIAMGTSTSFFALDPDQNSKETATAKRLTELRAEVIKSYLVNQGIEVGRISTKGEGGKMMIYPKTSTLANYNDRIEIEVLKGK